jgi:dienelactone hydrolase
MMSGDVNDGKVVVVRSDADLLAAACDPDVVGLVVDGGTPSTDTIDLVGAWKVVPVFVVASSSDPGSMLPLLDVYQASTHPDSDFEVIGPDGPTASAVASQVEEWTARVLGSVGSRREVRCTSDDGWQIHGSLTVPAGASGGPVPAAILLHSGRSDRSIFARLERLLARRGVAALSIDWRGRGQSQNKGTYFGFTADERAEAWRDARAAMSVLEDDPSIDASRVAMVGVVHGAEHAVAASIGDPRVRMLGVLTGFVPRNDAERIHLQSGDVDVMYVSCVGHGPVTGIMRDLVANTPPGRATLRVYPGGAIGYQLFDLDERLEDELATWIADGLGS